MSVYIRVENIELGSFPVSPKAKLCLWIGKEGNASSSEKFVFQSMSTQCISKIWKINGPFLDDQVIRILLVKSRIVKGDQPLGKIRILLNSFPSNAMVTYKFVMESLAPNFTSPTITITLHKNFDNSQPFDAPPARIKNAENAILHSANVRASFSAGDGFYSNTLQQEQNEGKSTNRNSLPDSHLSYSPEAMKYY